MKYSFRANVIVLICALLVACGQVSQLSPTSSTTPLPIDTLIPNQTATPQMEALPTLDTYALPTFSFVATPDGTHIPLPTPNPKIPTLIPTIDPNLVPDLLRKDVSVQTLTGVNGHDIRQITGWDYGFRQFPDNSYQWLDSNHLLLYPRTGEGMNQFMDGSRKEDLSSQSVIVNLQSEHLWLPWSNTPTSIYFSRKLGIVFLQEIYGSATGPTKEAVFTYTFDGQEIARYWGKILGVSPSGEKILVDDDTIIDLQNSKITDLAWYMNYDLELSSKLYWSSDETRLYRCCFYYADLKTGQSYDFKWSDLRGPDGKPLPDPMHSPHTDGQWVRNDTYFFPTWNYMSDGGDPRIMFSPTTKKYYFIERSNTSPIDTETLTYTFSPDGMYVWMRGVSRGIDTAYGFLSNLTTLETTSYDIDTDEFKWSPDGKFACLHSSPGNSSFPLQINLLSVSSKKLEPLNLDSCPSWRPNDHLLAYFAEEGQVLTILNPKDMSVKGWKLPSTFTGLIWSPDGNHIALVAKDGSFWRVDYPKMENFEQITQPTSFADVRDISWSPDSTSIAFIKGADIYIVETNK